MIFWIAVAILLLVGLVCVVLPVMRTPKDEQSSDRQQQNADIARAKKLVLDEQLDNSSITQIDYDSALLELQTALALDLEHPESPRLNQRGRWLAWFLVLALPLASIGLYLEIGEYGVIKNPSLAATAPFKDQSQQSDMSLEQMVGNVKERLAKDPDDSRSWFLLGKTMMQTGDYDGAVNAFKRTLELVGDKEAGVLFLLADALSMQNNGIMTGEPEAMIVKGLEIAPQDPTGRWLAGIAAEQRQDYKAAFGHMQILLPLVVNNEESMTEVNRVIAFLQQQDPTLVLATKEPVLATKEPVQNRNLTVTVNLIESLKQQVSSGSAVFIYVKAASGPPMPLAVKRITVADLPVTIELSDADAMIPTMKLSSFDKIIVGARVSMSGNPVAQPGDLYIETGSVNKNTLTNGVMLSISKTKY